MTQLPCGLFEVDRMPRLPGELLPRGVLGRCHALIEGSRPAVDTSCGAIKDPAAEAIVGLTVDNVEHGLSRHRYW
jgi:hypothetical protein